MHPVILDVTEPSSIDRAFDKVQAETRAFDVDAVDRLRFIKGAQRVGLRLQEIRNSSTSGIAVSVRAVIPRSY
jgi:hypothetical protein